MKKIKSIIIIFTLLLLFSTLFNIINIQTAKAVLPVNLKQDIELSWAGEADDPIIPRDEMKQINVTVSYSFKYAYAFSYGAYLNYISYNKYGFDDTRYEPNGSSAKGRITLKITNTPDWCHATFRYPVASVNVSTYYETIMPLYIIVDEDAPAYTPGYIEIEAKIGSFPTAPFVEGEKEVFNLTFTPSYNPSISVDLPDINTKQIAPHETATFPIRVSNLGNDQTIVTLRVDSLPDDWTATVTDSLVLPENGFATATINIRPPKQFGYREDVGIVHVSVTPARFNDLNETGDPLKVSFLVQSKGFMAEGRGVMRMLLLIPLFIAFLFVLRFIIRKIKDKL